MNVAQLIEDLTNASEEKLKKLGGVWAAALERAEKPARDCSPLMAEFLDGKLSDLRKCGAQTLRDLWAELVGKPIGIKSSGKLMKTDLIRHIIDIAPLSWRVREDYRALSF